MKYRVIAFRSAAQGSAEKRGKVLYATHDEAIKVAYSVAKHYHCMCRIEKVAE